MSQHIWSIVCRSVLTDRLTNSVSYIEAIETLTTPQLPSPAPQMMVGSLYARTGADTSVQVRTSVLGPRGNVIVSSEFQPTNFGDRQRMRINTVLGGFQVSEIGVHHLLIERLEAGKWIEDARIPIEIQQVEATKMVEQLRQRAAEETLASKKLA